MRAGADETDELCRKMSGGYPQGSSTPAKNKEDANALPSQQDMRLAKANELQDENDAESSDGENKVEEGDAERFENSINDVKIATIGNVDSGKSTLVGVLTKAMLDDGRGKARARVFNFSHEAANGRTSSIAQEIMGWNENGDQVLDEKEARGGEAKSVASRNSAWQTIVNSSNRMVTFIDLCGHEKYLKTTIFGLVGCCPDYALIVVNANAGFQRMSREHLGIALALSIPIFIVVTKIDMAPANVYEENMLQLCKLLKSKAVNKSPVVMKSEQDVATVTEVKALDSIAPIFCVSNVTGDGLPLLRLFLRNVPSRLSLSGLFRPSTEPAEFHIDGTFQVTGVGIVASGLLRSGSVVPNQTLLLGPDKTGVFKPVLVRGIHYRRVPQERVESGQACSFSLRLLVKKETLKKTSFIKGMVLVDPALKPRATWEFKAEVVILHHATTIRERYQAVIHCGVIRQAAMVKHMSEELLRTGDKSIVTFRFMYRGEYMTPGLVLLFREGRTKGLGRITELVHDVS